MSYLERLVDLEIDRLFTEVSAISIEAPKGVGKTTTAERRAASVYRLDTSAQREILQSNQI